MAVALLLVWVSSLVLLRRDLGKAKAKPKFRDMLSKSRAINLLSGARMFLFASRDVWFVVALPVFLAQTLGWDFWKVGGFLAAWVMGYGMVASARRRASPAVAAVACRTAVRHSCGRCRWLEFPR